MAGDTSSSADQISTLMHQINEKEAKMSDIKRIERDRSRAAWMKIKEAIRQADEKKLSYLRQWEIGKRDMDLTYQQYKQAKIQRKRVDSQIKLCSVKLKGLKAAEAHKKAIAK